MGRVHKDRLVQESARDACDNRCMGAKGPSCSCKCEGENHGAGILVIVTLGGDAKVPILHPPDTGAAERGQAWRALCQETKRAIARAYPELEQKAQGKWIANWTRYLEGNNLRRASRLIQDQVGPTRERTLRKLLSQG